MVHNIVSVSGGKDSTATLLVAITQGVENLRAVFADTGIEHPLVYDYLDYLERELGVPILRVKADFKQAIARKRKAINTKWRRDNVPERVIERAVAILRPTGIPFLDLCLSKGRFPSSKARFCTTELKVFPLFEQCLMPALESGMVISWQGVRRDESFKRRFLPECDQVAPGLFNYRPILKWPVEAVFEAHDAFNLQCNPLYKQGCARVGCMPCINEKKGTLANIADRWPWVIDMVEEWEGLVSAVNKRGSSTFFCVSDDPMFDVKKRND